jgi:beta-lactamase regulating signal transducer with metallopeptidase domain
METAALYSFFEWMLRASWQASVIAALVLLVQWLFQKELSPGWRSALWLLVLARLALPVSTETVFSVHNFTTPAAVRDQRNGGHADVLPDREVFSRLPASEVVAVPLAGQPPLNARETAHTLTTPPPLAFNGAQPAANRWLTALSVVWVAGAFLCALRLICLNARFRLRLRGAVSIEEPEVARVLDQCRERMRLRSKLRLFETSEVRSPALYGLFRPRLLLPAGMTRAFTLRELRFVFLHELAHVKRRDMLVNWLITLFQALHWLNPALWFAFNRMRADREMACDAMALSCAGEGDNQPYGETIIRILAGIEGRTALPGLVGILKTSVRSKSESG